MQPIKGTHDETQSARSRVLDITVENDVAGEEAKVIEFSEQILDAVFIDARFPPSLRDQMPVGASIVTSRYWSDMPCSQVLQPAFMP